MTRSNVQELATADRRRDRGPFIVLEMALVFLFYYLGLAISLRLGSDHMSLGGDLVIRQGPLAYAGLIISLIVLWMSLRRRGVGWGDLGLTSPKSWWRAVLKSLGIALVVLGVVVFIVNPLLSAIPNLPMQDLSSFEYLEGSLPNLLLQLVVVWVAAAFLEELLFRGYLMNRMVDLFGGPTTRAWLLAALGQAMVFGLVHSQQGLGGMLKISVIGVVFGLAYLMTNRNLWPLIIAHGLIDSLDMVSHYLGG